MNEEARKTSRADALAKRRRRRSASPSPTSTVFSSVKADERRRHYTSEIGWHQDLEYQGNGHLLTFSGCAHPGT